MRTASHPGTRDELCGAHGHFYPLVPAMRALAAAGHDVLAAVPSDFVDVVRAERLSAHGIAPQARTATERQDMRRRFEALEPRARIPAIVGNFVRVAEDGLDEIDALCASVAPDVILRESMAFAGWVLGAMRACPVIVLDVFPIPPDMWAALRAPRGRRPVGETRCYHASNCSGFGMGRPPAKSQSTAT